MTSRPKCYVPGLWVAATIAPTPTGRDEAVMLVTTPQRNAGRHMRHLIVGHLQLPDPCEDSGALVPDGVPIRCRPTQAAIMVTGDRRIRLQLGSSWRRTLSYSSDWVSLAARHERALLMIGTVPRPPRMDFDTYLDRHIQQAVTCFVLVTRTPVGTQ
jgi:hypothetical protein